MRVWRAWWFSAAAVVCIGCSPDRSSPDGSLPDGGAVPGRTSGMAARPPADSGLAIKRGTVRIAGKRATFRACGETADLLILDRSDGLSTWDLFAEGGDDEISLYVEAYGERFVGFTTDEAAGDSGHALDEQTAARYAGTFLLEQVLYAAARDQVRGCDAPVPEYRLAARGNEPFWALEVSERVLRWKQPDLPAPIEFDASETENLDGAERYQAATDGHMLELLVEMQPCQDSMSGEMFAFSAKAVLDGHEFTGCARLVR
ncbi:COG3650 family protein [Steroidobacter denitrificans]|uniref:COG3650 family protein n=1 Tax=Steroidobacter denitrificans TaxID=465721 RepID=UPI00082E1B7D|nr:hypothetical protein [Steroidobacter denitrificans]